MRLAPEFPNGGGYRLERAIKIVVDHGAKKADDGSWLVQSQHGADPYTVAQDATSCNCPDHKKGFYCKHQMAVRLITM